MPTLTEIVTAIAGAYEIDDGRSFWMDEPAAHEVARRILGAWATAELRSARARDALRELNDEAQQLGVYDPEPIRAASTEGGEVVAQFVVRDGELVTEAPPAEALCMRCHHPFEDVLHTDPNQCPTVVCVEKHHAFVAPQPTPPPAPRFTREVLQMFVNHDCSKFYAHDLAAHTERRDLARALLATEAQLAEALDDVSRTQARETNALAKLTASLAAHRADKGRIDQYAVGRVDQLTAEITVLTKRNARLVSDMTSNHIQYHGQTCPCLTRLEAEKESST